MTTCDRCPGEGVVGMGDEVLCGPCFAAALKEVRRRADVIAWAVAAERRQRQER